MFACYTCDHAGRMKLSQFLTCQMGKAQQSAGHPSAVDFGAMINDRRSSQIHAGWLMTWAGRPHSHGRTMGVDDDGPVRSINLGAFAPMPMEDGTRIVRELQLSCEVVDMIRF
jgi:hypothetical protein